MNDLYYRPEWTCGKYNAEKHVAIMFNLLTSGEFLFEKESADVIDIVLKAGRNGEISISQISAALDILPNSIFTFFESLVELGLLSTNKISVADVKQYREKCVAQPWQTKYIGDNAEYYIHCNVSSVEQAYTAIVQSCTGITSVMFELTYRCSEKCLHCYNLGATRNDSEKSGRDSICELSFDDYKRIIDEMCDAGLATATISGGDPFSNKNVWQILEYLYHKDIAVTILTNGQQLSNQVERLAELYPKSVRLSLYSADSKVHDMITRKQGSWQQTVDVISSLRANSVPVVINSVIMRPGVKSYWGLKAIGEKYSCPVLFDVEVVDSIEGDMCATNHLRLLPNEMELVLMDTDVEPDINNADAYSSPIPSKGIPCMAGKGTFSVMPDGKLLPCIAMHMVLGDLRKQDFCSIIKHNSKLETLKNAVESDYVECGTHDYCKCCFYCAGNSFSAHGTPFGSNENDCYVAKIRFSLMSKLQSKTLELSDQNVRNNLENLPDYKFTILHREYKNKGK